ncbi:MAG: hypothetical protein GC161_07445 [Planctomycetaceae bacterium]|nr:hypothetical protein [Planctomycetaceae bacterium]
MRTAPRSTPFATRPRVLLAIVLGLAFGRSAGGLPPGPGAAGEETVVVERADGTSEARSLSELPELSPTEGQALGPVSLVFASAEQPPPAPGDADPDRVELQLVGGDWLQGAVAGGSGERLGFGLAAGPRLDLTVDWIRRAVFPGRVPPGSLASLVAADDADRLYLRVGEGLDRVDGTLDGFRDEGLVFDGLAGRRTYPWTEVAAFFVAPLPGSGPQGPPPARPVAVDLVGGGRLTGHLVALGGDAVRLEAYGSAFALPYEAIRELAAEDGRLVHLGSLPPSKVDGGRPFGDDLGMVFAPRIDGAVHGGPLTTRAGTVARGIGVLAPTRMEWELSGEYARFLGSVAVDASTQRLGVRGSVRFAVELDGKRVWQSPLLTGADPAVETPTVDLAGAKSLALIAEDGGDGFAGDRANWLRARMVRSAAD